MAWQIMTALFRARRAVLLSCVGAWVIAAAATHLPAPELSSLDISDWTLHLAGYFVLGSLFWLSLTGYGAPLVRRVPVVLVVLIAYGALDEWTQGFVGRSPDVWDWVANVAGTVAAILVWETIARLLRIGPPHAPAKAGPGLGQDQPPAEKGPHS